MYPSLRRPGLVASVVTDAEGRPTMSARRCGRAGVKGTIAGGGVSQQRVAQCYYPDRRRSATSATCADVAAQRAQNPSARALVARTDAQVIPCRRRCFETRGGRAMARTSPGWSRAHRRTGRQGTLWTALALLRVVHALQDGWADWGQVSGWRWGRCDEQPLCCLPYPTMGRTVS